MEKIDVRKNFPVCNGGDGVLLSKRGDLSVGWKVVLPPAFRCNEEKYDSIIDSLYSAIQLLPDYCIVHKQDIFTYKHYHAENVSGFFQEAYERHFDNRPYLDHVCRIYLTVSDRKAIRGAGSGLLGSFVARVMPTSQEISKLDEIASQFEEMVRRGNMLGLVRLTEDDLFGTSDSSGILQDYLNFADEGEDILSDILLTRSSLQTGDKHIVCHLIADLDQLPVEVSSCKRVADLSTENSQVNLSFFSEIGQELDCEHIVNQVILKEPQKEILGPLNRKQKQMTSMSLRSMENRRYAEEINEYLEVSATEGMVPVHAYVSVFSSGSESEIDSVKDKVSVAISKLGITPVYNISNAPHHFWATIPGNEAGLDYHEYMTMDLKAALCLGIYDGFEPGIQGGVLKMSDRLRNIPVRFDIQEKAYEKELIENYNVFLLGPSGSGKSFFMNKYLLSCYQAGQHCFLIDVGDSYMGLCQIIKETSNNADGTYYTFEKGKPISFNPFRNMNRFRSQDSQSMNFLYTLMVTLWRNGEPIATDELISVKESVADFINDWASDDDPIFDDYYKYLDQVFRTKLEREKVDESLFKFGSYMHCLRQYVSDGIYGYLLNSRENIDILNDRFVVFEIDRIKDDEVIYPITTLVIMDAFMEKMSSISDFKVMCIEEAWKALMGTQMSLYMLELWKTARKHNTSAMVVTQELNDIISSPILKDTIVENSSVKILLKQDKYVNKFDVLSSELSLTEDDKSMLLSLNKYSCSTMSGREVFFNLGNKKSFIMRLEVSPEEQIAFSSRKSDKLRLANAVKATGSYHKAIRKIVLTSK